MNLAVQEGLRKLGLKAVGDSVCYEPFSAVSKVREFARHIRSSPQRKESFLMSACRDEAARMIPVDVPTRWNSTYDALETAVELRDMIDRDITRRQQSVLYWQHRSRE